MKLAAIMLAVSGFAAQEPETVIRSPTRLVADPMALPNPEVDEPPGRFDARFGAGARQRNAEEQIAEIERALARLNRNDIAVHLVDPRGLSTLRRSFTDTIHALAERSGGM